MSSDGHLTNVSAIGCGPHFQTTMDHRERGWWECVSDWEILSTPGRVHTSSASFLLSSTYIQHPQTPVSNPSPVCSNIIHSVCTEQPHACTCTYSHVYLYHTSTYMYLLLNWADKYLMPIIKRSSWSFLSAFAFFDKWLFTWIARFAAKWKMGCKTDWGCTNTLDKAFCLMLAGFFYFLNIKLIYWFQAKSYHFKNLDDLYTTSEMFHLS